MFWYYFIIIKTLFLVENIEPFLIILYKYLKIFLFDKTLKTKNKTQFWERILFVKYIIKYKNIVTKYDCNYF